MLGNRPEMLEAQSALGRIGAAAVTVPWRSTADELAYLVRDSGAKAIVVGRDVARGVLELSARGDLADVDRVVVGGPLDGFRDYEDLLAEPSRSSGRSADASLVIYTSGTTGRPKGAVRRFARGATGGLIELLAEMDLRSDDRHLTVCPLYHSTAIGFLGFTMAFGGEVVLAPGFDPEEFLRTIEAERITTTAVVPTMLHRVAALPAKIRARYDTSSLRAVFCGGAPLSGPLATTILDQLGPVLWNFYGATEFGIVTLATPDELRRSPGTIGHPVAGSELAILDGDGRPVPEGTVGELHVRNGMLIDGYHGNEDATRAALRDGFFRSGDLVRRDAAGLYHISGRAKDMIISGGVNVYPAEVEAAILDHPDVGEAAVIGVPDDEWGERVRAFVAFHDGSSADEDELARWLRERLAGPKRPREIRVLDALPRNPTGKVLKRELRRLS